MGRLRRFDAQAIKARAVAVALELGASEARVTDAVEDAVARDRMREAFARGDFATWGYDDDYAARAADPRTILRDARSVICIAVPYASGEPERSRLRGRVSNYAWSHDYHVRLRRMLAGVARTIDDAAGAAVTAIACDTKPLAERALAARAGLGWIGKHTNLIAREGSFVFLGEVVTSVRLPPDEASRKSCGDCVRCVEACPTGALRGDYTIDATRCIADLTQRTDAIPRAMRALVGDWVWGCDLCQLVCPPTQMAATRRGSDCAPLDAETAGPSLATLLRMRSGEFKRRFLPTAMGWRGAAVLRRNAAVALGNALDRSTVPALAAALENDPHPLVRGHAAWALGRIGSPAAIATLAGRREREADEGVREEIAAALEPFAARAR
jgi:epoxyqueuosine reductase